MSPNASRQPLPSFKRGRIFWPEACRQRPSLIPVFLPFQGCPARCVFCAQHQQSGTERRALSVALTRLEDQLEDRARRGLPPAELGFYGGTFTALPAAALTACLETVRRAAAHGLVRRARCSTRPDAVDPGILNALKEAGFYMVELGVQSFDDHALTAARRGYDGDAALRACAMVTAAGLDLGVQLLPGMPGVSPSVFAADACAALKTGARALRFYPCQVLEGTELARQWRAGAYAPWSLAETLPALARAWLAAQNAGIAVIRMGLAPEEDLEQCVLAGPRHPALGSMVQGLALYLAVREAVGGGLLAGLTAPRGCRGFFWGHKGSLRAQWKALGLEPACVSWRDAPDIEMIFAAESGSGDARREDARVHAGAGV